MSTCEPIFASIPFSSLPRAAAREHSSEASYNVDDLFDELDAASDSGYDEGGSSSAKGGHSANKANEADVDGSDGPQLNSGGAGRGAERSKAGGPSWTRWTSSKVTCLDTSFAVNEDRLECVWLVVGCEDGTVWIYCSVSLALTNTGATTPRSRAVSSSANAALRSSLEKPSIKRHTSDDHFARSLPTIAQPPSPRSAVSRAGPSSAAGTRSAHFGHSRKTRTSHSGSISLGVHGSSSPSGHSGTHTPAGRKASATVSVSETDVLLKEVTKGTPTAGIPSSSPMHGRASISLDQLVSHEPVDHHKIKFRPISRFYPKATHFPIVSIHFLPAEGITTPFVCLTANGQLFKCAARDGRVLAHLDVAQAMFPRSDSLSISRSQVCRSGESTYMLCKSEKTGTLVPVDLSSLTICPPVHLLPRSHCVILQQRDQSYTLDISYEGLVTVTPFLPSGGASPDSAHEAGQVTMPDNSAIEGVRIVDEDIVVFSKTHLKIFMLVDQRVTVLRTIPVKGSLLDVLVLSARRLALVLTSLIRIESVDEGEDHAIVLDLSLSENIEAAAVLRHPTSTADTLVVASSDTDSTFTVSLHPARRPDNTEPPDFHIGYQSRVTGTDRSTNDQATAAARIDDSTLLLGYGNGCLRFEVLDPAEQDFGLRSSTQHTGLSSGIIRLDVFSTTRRVLALACSNAGPFGIWDAYSRECLSQCEALDCPVVAVCQIGAQHAIVGASGAIVILDFEKVEQRQPLLLPAGKASLERLYTRQSQLLTLYEHGRARLWNVDDGKMQKAMSHSEAMDVLSHMEQWEEIEIPKVEAAPALNTNFRELVEEAASTAIAASQAGNKVIHPAVPWLLTRYLVPVEEDYVKDALRDHLHLTLEGPAESAFSSRDGSSLFQHAEEDTGTPLSVTQRLSADRLLVIVSLLRIYLNFADTERYANEVIADYATNIWEQAVEGQKDVSLDYLADFWLDESNDLRQAARLLFGSRVGRLSENEVLLEVQTRQVYMMQFSERTSKQLLILGELAIARQKLLASGALRDIANQIVRCVESVEDAKSTCIALELCIRGFSTFQNYLDAVRALRAIFRLAVNMTATPASQTLSPTDTSGIRNLSRQAILAAASINGPLFMTVLSIDAIQSDVDNEERATTLKLIAFMVRKKPVVLFGHLPRLVEAVVKSLDPRGTLRGSLQQTATFILSELVKTYPSVAFHGKTQRLAVGTHEGACIVYDLKTATRLYILDSHRRRASAVSYSPDGRRLVTISLEESNVKVWKVGASLLGLLTPAGPPPQGHGANSNEAYKTLDFKLASPEEAMMTAAAQLEWLNVEWLEERRVKISIRETALTFSVL